MDYNGKEFFSLRDAVVLLQKYRQLYGGETINIWHKIALSQRSKEYQL